MFSSGSASLRNYWQREREERGGKKGKVPHKARLIYLLSKAATGIDLR